MAMNPLPPQAYTRETLQEAYQWLLTQDSSIKEMASNQDILVSLYLKARRNGPAALETPSIQSFKKELKSLARLMGDFQEEETSINSHQAATNQQLSHQTHQAPKMNNNAIKTHSIPSPSSVSTKDLTAQSNSSTHAGQLNKTTMTTTNENIAFTKMSATSQFKNLDDKSYEALADVQNTLNLSSEVEALRALIALGYKEFKKINS